MTAPVVSETGAPVLRTLHLWFRWAPGRHVPWLLEASADAGGTWTAFPGERHASLYPITPTLVQDLQALALTAGAMTE